MAITYPPPAPTVSGDTLSIHTLLKSPTLIARRLRTILENRFIADAILKGRFTAVGGAVQFEQSESIFADRSPRAIRPGGEYPLTSLGIGPTQIAETVKWGEDALVYDEAIARLKRSPVDRAFLKLGNQTVRHVDGVALAVVASQVTAGEAAAASWATATAKQIFLDVAKAKAKILALNEGYDPDTVVIDDLNWAFAKAAFIEGGYLPRESASDNPVITGDFPVIDGMRWLATPNLPTVGTAMVLDSEQLGGMADEDLGGPGYTGAVAGVEAKSIRMEETDGYRLRARRVTVPVVLEPGAAREIAGI